LLSKLLGLGKDRSQTDPQDLSAAYLLVGLGNPGREYRITRHNVGFMTIDILGQSLNLRMTRLQSKALVATGMCAGNKIILAKPQTFMNLSGQPVSSLVRFYKMPVEHLLVILDDIDLPVGTLRMRSGGGSAGHKGLTSIIQSLGTQEFPRLRIGVGRPPGQKGGADYVLKDIPPDEQDFFRLALEKAAQAARIYLSLGIDAAMNQFNGPLDKDS
jgi:PTH1 family peptidyl-tRNA hydrolase